MVQEAEYLGVKNFTKVKFLLKIVNFPESKIGN